MLGYEFQFGPPGSTGADECTKRIKLTGMWELREKQSRFEINLL
jgi:hypothetical protein